MTREHNWTLLWVNTNDATGIFDTEHCVWIGESLEACRRKAMEIVGCEYGEYAPADWNILHKRSTGEKYVHMDGMAMFCIEFQKGTELRG